MPCSIILCILLFALDEHLIYPITFAELRTIAANTIGRYSSFRRNNPTTKKNDQHNGLIYRPPQKMRESTNDISAISSNDSNIHSLEPSSFTTDHHRNPTSSLPDIFFTVQKSNARRIMHRTNMNIKLLVIQLPNTYIRIASDLKRRWKKIATGC